MKGLFLMSAKELERKVVFEDMKRGVLTQKDASELLDICVRQCRRTYKRYLEKGDESLVHGNRGRPSNRAKPDKFRAKVLGVYEDKYEGWGPTLASEKLEEEDNLKLDHETLRRWLIKAKLWKGKTRKKRHRERRERKKHFGEMVQIDGSHHHWFGKDHPRCCLMQMIDDASGIRVCVIGKEETTELAMITLRLWIESFGIPKTVYSDKKTVFFTTREPTREEQLAGKEPLTAFGKALGKLGIKQIKAHSPQGKGRVERAHAVYQDRFVKEMKLKGITTIEKANKLLLNGFNAKINDKFARKAAKKQDFHRSVPKGMRLSEVFSLEDIRTLAKDWTVRHNNCFYQIIKKNKNLPSPGDKVIVRTKMNSAIQIVYRDKPLKYKLLPENPARRFEHDPAQLQKKDKKVYRPPADHPWRRSGLFPMSAREIPKGTKQNAPL